MLRCLFQPSKRVVGRAKWPSSKIAVQLCFTTCNGVVSTRLTNRRRASICQLFGCSPRIHGSDLYFCASRLTAWRSYAFLRSERGGWTRYNASMLDFHHQLQSIAEEVSWWNKPQFQGDFPSPPENWTSEKTQKKLGNQLDRLCFFGEPHWNSQWNRKFWDTPTCPIIVRRSINHDQSSCKISFFPACQVRVSRF